MEPGRQTVSGVLSVENYAPRYSAFTRVVIRYVDL